ncbi:hypothetical protein NA78x_001125 [Anatilimnocola sp. NA78]|uniref:hypothetical protein n=1 Tax=Anatilimnocola sp. NA78 TaxID=3415683 RepID=UPI003CE5C2DD
MERTRLRIELASIAAAISADLIDAARIAREHSTLKYLVIKINKRAENRVTVLIGRSNENSDGGGEFFRMKKADGKWQIEEQEVLDK